MEFEIPVTGTEKANAPIFIVRDMEPVSANGSLADRVVSASDPI